MYKKYKKYETSNSYIESLKHLDGACCSLQEIAKWIKTVKLERQL